MYPSSHEPPISQDPPASLIREWYIYDEAAEKWKQAPSLEEAQAHVLRVGGWLIERVQDFLTGEDGIQRQYRQQRAWRTVHGSDALTWSAWDEIPTWEPHP